MMPVIEVPVFGSGVSTFWGKHARNVAFLAIDGWCSVGCLSSPPAASSASSMQKMHPRVALVELTADLTAILQTLVRLW